MIFSHKIAHRETRKDLLDVQHVTGNSEEKTDIFKKWHPNHAERTSGNEVFTKSAVNALENVQSSETVWAVVSSNSLSVD